MTSQASNSTWKRDAAIASIILVVLVSLPFATNKGIVFVAGTLALHIVFGLSWNLMFGQTGLVSFGHASFFAIGGYAFAWASKIAPGLHPLLLFAGVGLLGSFVALIVGILALRRSIGVYFAILTLALSQIVYLLLSYIPALGREDGFTGIRRPHLSLGFTTIDLASGNNYYYFMIVMCTLLAIGLWWVMHGRMGRVFKSIQQDAERAAFLGIDVQAYRLRSFAIASGTTAIAGALYAPWLQLLTPEIAHWTFSARPILYTLLGGVQSFWGPAVGAFVFAVLEYGTRTLHGLSEIIIGSILLVVVLAFPGGLLGGLSRLRTRMTRKTAVAARPEIVR
ncbi:branched-chain amino acid ABC transporter permease [Microvirga sp. 2MCAF38]|uniref:branched-chain amino acid ABC transporter permease n=1 Tax=Microvirga sp. 2MCAF38 TaxID=3232989 RepID=UPI003F9E99B5